MTPRPSPQPGAALVAIVGAPNVGKSTLFNRLVGRRRAIVTDRPGITRDRIYGTVRTGTRTFTLCDTGGLRPGEADPLTAEVVRQTEEAIAEADVLLFLVDGRTGLTPLEQELAGMLRRRGKPIVLAVNKIDSPASVSLAAEYHGLGLGEPLPLSAEHGLGMPELLDALEEALGPLPEPAEAPAEETVIAIVGRPNVGKSSLLNRILRQDRMTVSERPGTTRDSVDILVERNGRAYRFVDTAGIRRKGRTKDVADILSVVAARKSLESADVVLLVLDASEPIAAQDQTVGGYAARARRPLILVGNKWDLVKDPEAATAALRREAGRRFRFAAYAPLITVSALTGQRVERILPLVDTVDRASHQRVPTAELNRFLQREGAAGRGPKLLYMTQTGIRPPSFLIFTHDASRVHFSTRRRLENRLRERFGFGPTPLVLRIRSRGKGRGRS